LGGVLGGCQAEPDGPAVNDQPILDGHAPEVEFDYDGDVLAWDAQLSGRVVVDLMVDQTELELSSDKAGLLWEGEPDEQGHWSWKGTLEPGSHWLSMAVRDVQGWDVVIEHEVNVRDNTSPDCRITSPSMGDVFQRGEPIQFAGQAQDPEQDSVIMLWQSSVTGPLFEGNEWACTINVPGEHVIILNGRDEFGAQCFAEVPIVVLD